MSDNDPIDEELVAYLDGELDAEQSRLVEQRAATDPGTRRSLEELDRSWHLLDDLDESITNEDFTRTTLEMVALAAADDAQQAQAEAPRRRWRRWIVASAVIVVAGLCGFGLATALVPDPNAQVLHDLPLLDNLDEYRQVDNIAFLRALRSEKLFVDEAGDSQAASASPVADETLAQRKQRIVDMSPSRKEEIFRRNARFLALPPAEQQRVRALHDQLQAAADGAKLRETMNRYCQWLSGLAPFTRAKISDQKPEERIAKIKEIVREQSLASVNHLQDKKDRAAVVHWMDNYATEHEARFVDSFGDKRRGPATPLNPVQRHRAMMQMLLRHWQADSVMGQPPLSDAEIAGLKKSLSPKALEKLDGKSPPEQAKMISQWLRDVAHQELANRRSDGAMSLPGYEEEIAEFFETKLSDEARDRLMALPGEEMQQQLRAMYMQQLKPGEGWRQHGDHSGRGGKRPGGFSGLPMGGRRDAKDSADNHPGKDFPRSGDRPPPDGFKPDGPRPDGPRLPE